MLEQHWGRDERRFFGLRAIAVDKTTLALPEAPAFFKAFGYHKTGKGLTCLNVEMACVFHVLSRAPFAWVCARACTSEIKLMARLLKHFKANDLVLIDNGFYSFGIFTALREKACHFLCPMTKAGVPRLVRRLGPHDYLATIRGRPRKGAPIAEMTVRVVYVYRQGFRRRRLVTSLLDPKAFPAGALARLYHYRWDVETFFRDFKSTMKGNTWHCRSVENFHRELAAKMILVCLIRLTMTMAAKRLGCLVGSLSFARALTATRVFFATLLAKRGDPDGDILEVYIQACCCLVRSPPERQFLRDQQAYRRKARNLVKKKRGRPPKQQPKTPRERREVVNDRNGPYLQG